MLKNKTRKCPCRLCLPGRTFLGLPVVTCAAPRAHTTTGTHTRVPLPSARTGSRFLPGAAAAGGISDLLMKRSDCAAGACQAEMSARGDWITLWPVSLRCLQTAAAPRSTISFSFAAGSLPPWGPLAVTKGRAGDTGTSALSPEGQNPLVGDAQGKDRSMG